MPISDVLAAILAAVLLFRDKTLKIKQS